LTQELIAIVPARGGSRRVPGKNIRKFAGRSLLAHVARAMTESCLAAEIILTTDDAAIADEGIRLGWSVPFRRPSELATDTAPTIDAIFHLLDWRRDKGETDPEFTLVLQPTSPMRRGSSIVKAVEWLREDDTFDSVIGMQVIDRPAFGVFAVTEDGSASAISPDDVRTPVYIANGAIFLVRTAALRRDRSLYAGKVAPLVMDKIQSIDIDNEADFKIAAALLGIDIEPTAASPVPSRAT
jgi:CMP-N,N'-diacetyllegionaminic acid synthase